MIIGLIGQKRSGKDTVAAFAREWAEARGVSAERFAFADALKQEVAQVCGVTLDYIEVHKARYRAMLQWWGTEYRRVQFGDDYWVSQVADRLDEWEIERSTDQHAALAVVTDCRFANECKMVREHRGELVSVVRPGLPAEDAHVSEQVAALPFNFQIVNDGTLELLRLRTGVLLDAIFQQARL